MREVSVRVALAAAGIARGPLARAWVCAVGMAAWEWTGAPAPPVVGSMIMSRVGCIGNFASTILLKVREVSSPRQ